LCLSLGLGFGDWFLQNIKNPQLPIKSIMMIIAREIWKKKNEDNL